MFTFLVGPGPVGASPSLLFRNRGRRIEPGLAGQKTESAQTPVMPWLDSAPPFLLSPSKGNSRGQRLRTEPSAASRAMAVAVLLAGTVRLLCDSRPVPLPVCLLSPLLGPELGGCAPAGRLGGAPLRPYTRAWAHSFTHSLTHLGCLALRIGS